MLYSGSATALHIVTTVATHCIRIPRETRRFVRESWKIGKSSMLFRFYIRQLADRQLEV